VKRFTLMVGAVMSLGACGQAAGPPPPGSGGSYYVDAAAGNDG